MKKIGIVGTRGIPANYGGFETFAEELSTRLVDEFEVIVYCENHSALSNYKGVQLEYMSVGKSKHPFLFYYKSIKCAIKECDIVLVCGNGGTLFFTLLKLFVKKTLIVLNPDGLEHLRGKWSWSVRKLLKLMEWGRGKNIRLYNS